jgi:hypothetical protein
VSIEDYGVKVDFNSGENISGFIKNEDLTEDQRSNLVIGK